MIDANWDFHEISLDHLFGSLEDFSKNVIKSSIFSEKRFGVVSRG